MSTLKYKMSSRYSFGWSDPRVMSVASSFDEIANMEFPHYASTMSNDGLKAAWLLEYGDRPITFFEIRDKWVDNKDAMRIAQETHMRGLLLEQPDFASYSTIYVLKDKLNASS